MEANDADEDEDLLGDTDLVDGCLLHNPVLSTEDSACVVDLRISDKDALESLNAKRKLESGFGLFCVMRKRPCRQNSVDDIFPDLDDVEKDGIQNCLRHESDFTFEHPNDILDESATDTDLSDCSEFDVISQHVLEDNDLIGELTGSKSVYVFPTEDKGTLVSKFSSGNRSSILVLSPDEVNEENGVNSDILKTDGDTSSAIEIMHGDVVNKQGSIESLRSNDELKLWNKEDESIPINIVPPDCGSSLLLETCSVHQIFRCVNEYNLHDDNLGLEICPLPLIKTLEGPSRPWSVCGSIGAVTNISLLETRSGACSSLGEQLDLNLGSSENMDTEVAQTASTLYQEEVDEICFSDIDAMILRLNLIPDDSDSCLNREEWNKSKHPRHALPGLEHTTRTSIQRAIMSQGAMAVLNCSDSKHFIRKREVIIGRSCDGLNVDIDLGKYGYGSKISRRQALMKLENNGSFSLMNLGKLHILVNGEKLNTGEIATLSSCSSINIRDIVFVFKINKGAVRQFLKKNIRRNNEDDTKFRWCE